MFERGFLRACPAKNEIAHLDLVELAQDANSLQRQRFR
jgi:hypothetical protein